MYSFTSWRSIRISITFVGNSWGKDPINNRACLGCGPQEEFYACADVAVESPTGALPLAIVTAAPPPTVRPTPKPTIPTTARPGLTAAGPFHPGVLVTKSSFLISNKHCRFCCSFLVFFDKQCLAANSNGMGTCGKNGNKHTYLY